MSSNEKTAILMMWNDKLNDAQFAYLSKELENINIANKKALDPLYILELKSPIIGLALGFFLGVFSVDRFYKGDIGYGIAKLLLGWLTLFIWNLIDIYYVYVGIQKDNFDKISSALLEVKRKNSYFDKS